ncbi:hypothetical protein B566_EDAN001569 [Ephemera danica]|nr:hypothetical protein B566_EDAN001569 [Ephemera danica]
MLRSSFHCMFTSLSFSLSSEGEEADTADSLEIRPPQASIHHKERMHKRMKPTRDQSMSSGSGRHPRKESHRKSGHHRSREHRSERHREKRHHRDRRDMKGRERERGDRISNSMSSRERGPAPSGPPPLMGIGIEDLRVHLDRRSDKTERVERRSGSMKEQYSSERDRRDRDRPERPVEEMPVSREIRETPRERAERLERERRRDRLLMADREKEKQKETYRRELAMRRVRRTAREHQVDDGEHVGERSRSRERRKHEDGPREAAAQGSSGGDDVVEIITDDGTEEEEEEDDDDEEEGDENEAQQSGEESQEQSAGEVEEEEEEEEAESTDEGSESTASDSGDSDDNAEQHSDQNGAEDAASKEGSSANGLESPQEAEVMDQTPPRSDEEIVEEEEELPQYLPAIQGCRSVEEFQCLNRIEEGTYGVVYRARDKSTNEIVALKRLKMEKEKEGFPITSLREINTLLKAQHPNIVTVREIVVGSNMDKIFIVMDYVEHDLKSLMETMKQRKQVFIPGEVKCLMQQLLRAVAHLHDNWILHRDLKTSNLLLSHKGILKVGDFGLAREYGSPLKPYTPIVVTLWYRSPELLLGVKEYSTPIDVWSVGCIFGELLLMEALFPGKSEIDQLNKIFKEMGTPSEKIWPGYSKLPAVQKMTFAEFPVSHLRAKFATMLTEQGFDLMSKFLTFDPAQRVTAEDALKHDYFREPPLPIDPAMFPTWPAKSEMGHRKAQASPKPPSGGREYKQLGDADEDVAGSFHLGIFEHPRTSAVGAGFRLKF